jgi:hypothetical protein
VETVDSAAAHDDSQQQDEEYQVNPVGAGLAVLGALCAIISVFLPLVDATGGFGGVQKNSLIQASAGAAARYIIAAAVILSLTWRYHTQRLPKIGVAIAGAIVIAMAIADHNNKDLFTLYPIDPSTNSPDATAGGQEYPAGLALYVAGVGGGLALLGGWWMKTRSDWIGELPTPVATSSFPPPPMPPELLPETGKKCPDCAEMVKVDARVCRFCGYRFDQAPVAKHKATTTSRARSHHHRVDR